MRIQRVHIKNFRNVPDTDQELNGSNIILLADNRFGKSNFIKALQGALAGKVGKDAIKHGQKKAEVNLDLADFNEKGEAIPGTEYKFALRIDKVKDTDEEKVMLELWAPNGMRETKKTTIGSIAGEIELDYNFVELSKTADGKKKQVAIIKSYLDQETLEALRVWESKGTVAYNDRTEVNRNIKQIDGYLKKINLSPEDFKVYAEPKKFDEVQGKLIEANKVNNQIISVSERLKGRKFDIDKNATQIKNLEEQIRGLLEANEELTRQNAEAEKWLETNKTVDVESLNKELSEIGSHNEKHAQVKDFLAKKKEKDDLDLESGDLTALIDSSKQAIMDTLRQMDFPVKGITFDDENVYFHGKLVDETAMSTAEIMMLEAELKMAKHPQAEVLFIQRGESLGLNLLKELQATAKERGMQIIMEQVERGTEELKIEIMPTF